MFMERLDSEITRSDDRFNPLPDGYSETDLPLIERLKRGGSPFRQYQDLFVGNRSFIRLVAYELIFGWATILPGALGYATRKKMYPLLLRHVGSGVLFGRGMTVRNPARISLGQNVTLDDGIVLDAKGTLSEGITIGSSVWIGRHTIVTSFNGRIRMGDYVSTGPFCNFSSHSFIDIGSHVSISPYCAFLASSKDISDPTIPMLEQKRSSKGIRVGNNVWIGTGVVVLDGVEIGSDVVIAAGAVVNKSVPSGTVAGGLPAKVIRNR
jgi:acetyltransferase-like isoleucine patch superfamily enzyme